MTTRPSDDSSLLEDLIAEPAPARRIEGVLVARVEEILADGNVRFAAPGVAQCAPARSLVDPATLAPGAEIAVSFEAGDPNRGLVLGAIFGRSQPARVAVDDVERELVLEAEREIVLRCGEASIRLTRDGRIVLRGVHVLSRARVSQRIKGGSVQIN